jgi:hypothetical protein
VLMNPWYGPARRRGRYYVSELVAELYRAAEEFAADEHGRAVQAPRV